MYHLDFFEVYFVSQNAKDNPFFVTLEMFSISALRNSSIFDLYWACVNYVGRRARKSRIHRTIRKPWSVLSLLRKTKKLQKICTNWRRTRKRIRPLKTLQITQMLFTLWKEDGWPLLMQSSQVRDTDFLNFLGERIVGLLPNSLQIQGY